MTLRTGISEVYKRETRNIKDACEAVSCSSGLERGGLLSSGKKVLREEPKEKVCPEHVWPATALVL